MSENIKPAGKRFEFAKFLVFCITVVCVVYIAASARIGYQIIFPWDIVLGLYSSVALIYIGGQSFTDNKKQ